MPLLREWIHRLLGTLRRGRRDRDLEEELRLHMELAAEEAHRRGEPLRRGLAHGADSGRQRAAGHGRRCAISVGCRGSTSWRAIFVMVLRALRRTPSFTAVALLTLALGIGANTAIYQLLDAIRIRTLPVKDPEQLVVVRAGRRPRDG